MIKSYIRGQGSVPTSGDIDQFYIRGHTIVPTYISGHKAVPTSGDVDQFNIRGMHYFTK